MLTAHTQSIRDAAVFPAFGGEFRVGLRQLPPPAAPTTRAGPRQLPASAHANYPQKVVIPPTTRVFWWELPAKRGDFANYPQKLVIPLCVSIW